MERCAYHTDLVQQLHHMEARQTVADDQLGAVLSRVDKATEKMERATEALTSELTRFETRWTELLNEIRKQFAGSVPGTSASVRRPRSRQGRPPGTKARAH